jgi:hypothetical protein
VEKLKARGIITTRATVARDVEAIRREFAAETRAFFDPLAAIGVKAERYRAYASRAYRAALQTKDDGDRHRRHSQATMAESNCSRRAGCSRVISGRFA